MLAQAGDAEIGGGEMRLTLEQGRNHLGDVVDHMEADAVFRPQALDEFAGEVIFQTGRLVAAINIVSIGSVMGNNNDFLAFPGSGKGLTGSWQALKRSAASMMMDRSMPQFHQLCQICLAGKA